ncbi:MULTISPECIES: serine/threonine-protein kinase [unclassified Pseudoalteromonas]|uniref:serine/threonine-protein kinase n=1 Tax=unclassified Pseudoalteromonas TaxID=194690 RepID=UPI0030154129
MKGPHTEGDRIVSRYTVVDFVGEGGMQFVYKARDEVLSRFVALKTPKDATAEKRFHRSAIVSSRVNHPNVAKTLDYVEESGRPYLIEELIEGLDLSCAILKGVEFLDPFLVAKIFHHLSKGLAASHHAGVLHRDLKPTNIMVAGQYQLIELKITDFGIAKMAEEEIVEAAEGGDITNSTSATAVGALPYMAPEAIDTPRKVTLKADVWSLGAMMYELLTGSKPFGSGLRAVRHIMDGKYDPFPPFITANPQFSYLSSELIMLIKSCLNVSVDDRPTADELVEKCGELCYQVSERFIGTMKSINHQKWGFITLPTQCDVFYHVDSVYGTLPEVGEKVMFSKYVGGGADRALPVIKLKTP